MQHPWIEDLADYEAVLRCTHELNSWDRTPIVRCYQTWGFDNASTDGDELQFRHEDTGVMLKHDGGVVAIEFGEGRLREALADLVSVLSDLGWRTAVVFHPEATLPQLLNDIGSAIPAHLQFDVHAAEEGATAVEAMPEATALVERGRSLMHPPLGGSDGFNEAAFSEMSALGADVALADFSEEMPSELDFSAVRPGAPGDLLPPDPHSRAFDDEAPMIPLLGQDSEKRPGPSRVNPYVPQRPVVEPAVEQRREDEVARATEPLECSAPSSAQLLPTDDQSSEANKPAASARKGGDRRVFRVGRSALCFDVPNEPLSDDEVERVADEVGAGQRVVHVWPGLINQPLRWSALGEITLDAPWFAQEICVAILGADSSARERHELAMQLVEVIRRDQAAQLRDISVLPEQLLAISLSADGESFVDSRTAVESARVFTLRELLTQERPEVIAVHVDPADGPFVHSVVALLRWVAERSEKTTRATKQAALIARDVAREAEAAQQRAQFIEFMRSAAAGARAIGIDVNVEVH